MDRARIKERLKLSLLNVTLAVIAKQDGELTKAVDMLYNCVEEIVRQAQREVGTGKQ